jgi:hypothetical protein
MHFFAKLKDRGGYVALGVGRHVDVGGSSSKMPFWTALSRSPFFLFSNRPFSHLKSVKKFKNLQKFQRRAKAFAAPLALQKPCGKHTH